MFSGWWLLSTAGSAIFGVLSQPSTSLEPELALVPPPLAAVPTVPDSTDDLVAKMLQHPNIQNIFNNYNHKISQITSSSSGDYNDDKLVLLIDNLRDEINEVKSKLKSSEKSHQDDLNSLLMRLRSENSQNLARVSLEMRKCCRKTPMIDIEHHITSILTKLLNDDEFLSRQYGFKQFLHSLFVAKSHLEERLANLTSTNHASIDMDVGTTADKVMDEVVTRLTHEFRAATPTDFNERSIVEIVNQALKIYDADKTGLVDYAMEPMGGQIVTTRCTEHYNAGTAVVSVLGIPLWYPTNTPRTVITPGINPGECWAFQNFPGFLVVKLAGRVRIEAFSLEHISRLLVPDGRIDSAPKDFDIYGLIDEHDKDPVLIGEYTYDYDGDALQYFTAREFGLVFENIELRIKSNHGNPNYTCLYRFRVHGTLIRDGGST